MTELQKIRLEIESIFHYFTTVTFGFYKVKEDKTKEKIARLNYLMARLDELEKEDK